MSAPPPAAKDAPDVIVHPPILFAGLLILGIALDRIWPIRLPYNWPWPEQWPGGDETILMILGWGVLVLGFVYAGAAIHQFRRARTNIPTFRPATALATSGIYRYSRNPMYAGIILLQTALALLFGNWWLAILLVPLIATLRYGVVAREEAYLEAKFGDDYRSYKERVKRRF